MLKHLPRNENSSEESAEMMSLLNSVSEYNRRETVTRVRAVASASKSDFDCVTPHIVIAKIIVMSAKMYVMNCICICQ